MKAVPTDKHTGLLVHRLSSVMSVARRSGTVFRSRLTGARNRASASLSLVQPPRFPVQVRLRRRL